jgi:lysophospholipase L1-like esterase
MKKVVPRLIVVALVLLLTYWSMSNGQFWRFQIYGYERADQAQRPKPGVIVFTGSSSIRFWHTLAEDMKPLDVINRGFGGSELAHVIYFADRIIIPYRPRAVVLYAGDNDLTWPWSKSPEVVLQDFKRFVGLIHKELPETWIYYISMKPAPVGNWELFKKTNGMIEAYIRTQDRSQYIDVSSAMLDAQGHLRRELYGKDPMHMNDAGYAVWTTIVKPVLVDRFWTPPS